MKQESSLTWDFYKSVKERSFCLICNSQEHQFHHVKPAEKISEIARIARVGNLDLLKHEFNKCVPLCETCHRAVHKGHIKGWMDGVTNYGSISNDAQARRYMPFLDYIGEPDIITTIIFSLSTTVVSFLISGNIFSHL